MPSPFVKLTSAAKIEFCESEVAITVIAGGTDDQELERIYAQFRNLRLFRGDYLTLIRLIEFKARGDDVVWLGVV
ncbi:hypothetical protein [Lacipirellula parvula]|uniref:Uncharacterized protein n=1 Tax=Lacipirellula parvula TaxID=2650471 RepID=A0A5K7X9K5_9BACT|nr:hypothetical protein [Lacipirellula parvula]BBO33400.1 hypothetical protein PLANPX_3012 [Lacipirellula parvula]